MSILLTKSGLEVKPLDTYYKTHVSKPIPSPDFVMFIVAPKGSGKTTLLLNLLGYYNKSFSAIYIFSATVKYDHKWDEFIEKLDQSKEKKVFETFDPALLERLMKQRDETKQKNNVLIIYDDMISDNRTFAKWGKNAITRSIFNARHYGISTIVCSQKYTEIPANIRGQCDNLMVSRLSQMELTMLYDNMTGLSSIPSDQFKILYSYATNERFSFLNIDVMTGTLYKNFDKLEWKDKHVTEKTRTKRQRERDERRELKRQAKDILTMKGVLMK